MEDSKDNCLICSEKLEERNCVLVTKGLKTLIDASLKREDGLHKLLEGNPYIRVHRECRQHYTRPSSIVASKRMHIEDASVPSSPQLLVPPLLESKETFKFEANCLLCGTAIRTGNKVSIERRKEIRTASTFHVKNSLLTMCENRNDDWGEKVRARILSVSDLVASEAHYHVKCFNSFSKSSCKGLVGRKMSDKESFSALCRHIEDSDECQFTIRELQEKMTDISGRKDVYSDMHLKNLLLDYFKDRLLISNVTGRKNILCLSDKIIDTWYKDHNANPAAEKLRIVLAAADIIKEDIQKMAYDNSKYPNIEEIKSGGEGLIPNTLLAFTRRVTKKKNASESEKVNRKCLTICHSIVSAVRPRSFLSPLHVSLALTLHRLYASKHLLNMLSSLGICSSYYEACVYMNSLISSGLPKINEDGFIQHVFDNADVNVRTLDGLNTFHAMGGIQCITPSSSVDTEITVQRRYSGTFNPECIKMRSYPRKMRCAGLSSISVKDYAQMKSNVGLNIDVFDNTCFPLNTIWLSGLKTHPGWNGFMNVICQSQEECSSTYIMAVPFINMDATNTSTIYTSLCFAADESRKQKQSCVVTFDQPLFLKASEIVAAEKNDTDLSKVVLRLGGFHLLMSFMGSVGHIMEGSGLESLWCSVYGSSTVLNMLNGHSYARCIRAYALTASAIVNVMTKENAELKDSMQNLNTYHAKLVVNDISIDDALNNPAIIKLCNQVNASFNTVSSSSRTATLWVNLLKCIDLMFKFIFAERTGNWDMHVATVVEMLPFFHAAGHLPYAKSAHLYAQEMMMLHTKLTESELERFTKKGMFAIRRSGKFWSGTWTDMCIEQCLMRPMKSVGGLTHGRGLTDSVLSKWIHGTAFVLKVQQAVEDFLGTSIAFTEQHVELRESRKNRDIVDLEKFTVWLSDHSPFTKASGELVSLASGRISDESVNCDKAREVGIKAMENMKGQNFGNLKLKRKDMVNTQGTSKKVKVRSKEVTVNPQQLFNRILCVCDSPIKLREYLAYELSSTPPSLFDDVSLRKGTKSSLMKAFKFGLQDGIDLRDATYVIDGGYLIHSVGWQKDSTFGEIIDNYCSNVILNYGTTACIVFDGYPDYSTTKNEEQNRRSAKKTSCDIEFDSNTKCLTPQESFLGNKRNKYNLLKKVAAEMERRGLLTFMAEEDADVDIIRIAIEKLNESPKVVVVGSDTDLIVLLIALAPEKKNIYFCKPRSYTENPILYNIAALVKQYGQKRRALLFAHAVTGCDTTSSLYGCGKVKAIDILNTSSEAVNHALVFTQTGASKPGLLASGEAFILALYGLSRYKSLNEARYFKFASMTKKSTLRSNFDLSKLPPTTEASEQHLFRVYLQVQKWLGNSLSPTEWGWKFGEIKKNEKQRRVLTPIPSMKNFAPAELLYIVSCSCKSSCGNYCGCRKSGLHCSSMCEHCCGLSCNNSTPTALDDDTEEFIDGN